jgi:folylpolyglutamate synthase
LNDLNFIHVAGTKGKGSTCAMVERILRKEGVTTGLYTSPHILEVRERIRIDGKPLSKEAFARYFYQVWDMMDATQELAKKYQHSEYPGYFRFLTLMAFHVFRQEGVEASILEVGIGGEYDATNVITKPIVCAISSLGYDHQIVLGNTLSEIAWHKAGIFKHGVRAVTSPQLDEAMKVVVERAEERSAPLALAPPLDAQEWPIHLGLDGQHQWQNAGLAVDISRLFIQKDLIPTTCEPIPRSTIPPALKESMMAALEEAKWPGRAQTIRQDSITWHFDGAHTPESLQVCTDWYAQVTSLTYGHHILIFNCTSGRSGLDLLKPLVQLQKQYKCWKTVIFSALSSPSRKDFHSKVNKTDLTAQRALQRDWQTMSDMDVDLHVVPSVDDAIELVQSIKESNIHVLVTGSLHLVGNMMSAIGSQVE